MRPFVLLLIVFVYNIINTNTKQYSWELYQETKRFKIR
jgi:hypothetical protein